MNRRLPMQESELPFEHREIDARAIADDVMLNVKLAIEEYMDNTGKGEREVAETMGVSQYLINQFLKGHCNIKIEDLIWFMARLGIPVKITIEGDE
jgi:predicted XRE-type DNA-binding protein